MSLAGLVTGAVVGLAAVTPAAAYVSPLTAVIIGIASGAVSHFVEAVMNMLHWNDGLDVWGVDGVSGALGIVLLGVFALSAFDSAGTDGLVFGNGTFFIKRLVAVAISSVWALGFSYGMLWLIDRATSVRVDQAPEQSGLDAGLLGGMAYVVLDG